MKPKIWQDNSCHKSLRVNLGPLRYFTLAKELQLKGKLKYCLSIDTLTFLRQGMNEIDNFYSEFLVINNVYV